MAGHALLADLDLDSKEGRMNFAVSLWQLVQHDRLVRWATYATAGILWFAIAWADVRILIVGMGLVGFMLWWLRRQRQRHGWFQEREVDIDLL
jgi:uncharacterized iron-regulated membrane protein